MQGRALRLTIFVTRTDQWHWQSVAYQIVLRANKAGLAGATIVHAIAGYGGLGPVRTQRRFSLAQHLPALIVIVDTEEKIRTFLPQLDDLVTGGGSGHPRPGGDHPLCGRRPHSCTCVTAGG